MLKEGEKERKDNKPVSSPCVSYFQQLGTSVPLGSYYLSLLLLVSNRWREDTVPASQSGFMSGSGTDQGTGRRGKVC